MNAGSKRWLPWLGLGTSALIFALWVGLRVKFLYDHGQQPFWLEVLFAPSAFFTVLSVTFIERLVLPDKAANVPKKGRKKPR